jgi:hypothetical protein
MVEQEPLHHLGSNTEELRPLLPVSLPLTDEPEMRLVHQPGGLQSVTRGLAAQQAAGLKAQLVEGRTVASAPSSEQIGDGV